MQTNSVYLDHAATTPLDHRVLAAMMPHFETLRANPSSLHAPGVSARDTVEDAREAVADLIGSRPGEILFTSGGTESDALAVLGVCKAAPDKRHLVLSAIEHPAVAETARHLESTGYEVTRLGVDAGGLVDPAELVEVLRPDTALVAVMWANNEVGTIQPVAELAEVCEERGVPFHADAVQAVGHLPADVGRTPVSTLALTGHKFYGPSGVGALYVRDGVALEPVLYGGGQEKGLRSGTENVAGLAGLAAASRLAAAELGDRQPHETALRDRVVAGVTEIPGVYLNGHPEKRLPNNVHLSVEGVESESLVLFLDSLGYAVGSGSACASHSAGHRASSVLLAMNREFAGREGFSTVRVTVGKDNTVEEVDGFVQAFSSAVGRLRELSPVYTG